MKRFTLLLAFMLIPSFSLMAQTKTEEELVKEEVQAIKQEIKKDYSKFSIGLYGGLPFTQGGDMVTLAEEKTYLGYMGGLQLGYQFNPIFGMSLTGQYGMSKAGPKSEELDYMLLPSGQTHYALPHPAEATAFRNVYSKINHITAGLHFDFNIIPLFNGSPDRKVALILSPAVYMQKFSPVVNKVSDDSRFTTTDLDNGPSLGLGGDVDLRIRASKTVDFMIKAGAAWITNNNFDGIDNTGTDLRYGALGHVAVGVVFKPGKDKVDNMLYAPTGRYINSMAAERVAAKLEAERIAAERAEAERLAAEKAEAERLAAERAAAERRAREEAAKQEEAKPAVVMEDLPTVHFVRGSAKIDTNKYATELATLVKVLTDNPEIRFEIAGFCDHTGSEAVNDRLAERRAEALRDYLVGQGVDASRITLVPVGKDPNLTGEAAYSVKARRVELK